MNSAAGAVGRTRVRPTAFGAVLAVLVVVAAVAAPAVSDVAVAGMVWVALLALLVVGAVLPPLLVRGVGPGPARSTDHARVGDVAEVVVPVGRRPAEVRVSGPGGTSVAWLGAGAGADASLDVPLARRGEFRRVSVDVSVDAPFGVVRATRRLLVPLARPLVVAPVPTPADVDPGPLREPGGGTAAAVATAGDVIRSVRPYVPGDPAHLVHWPTTARAGAPVVRELEPPDAPGLAVVVDLGPASDAVEVAVPTDPPGPDGAVAEAAVARAAGAARSVLERGGRVLICACVDGRPCRTEVTDLAAVDRCLAAAGPGPVAAPPSGWPRWSATGGSVA